MYHFAYIIIISYHNGPPAWGFGEGLKTPHRKKKKQLFAKPNDLELGGSSEHGNKISGSIKGGEFLD